MLLLSLVDGLLERALEKTNATLCGGICWYIFFTLALSHARLKVEERENCCKEQYTNIFHHIFFFYLVLNDV